MRPVLTRLRALTGEDQRVLIVLVLTLATGVVDAVSYFSLQHVFTANMSGNMALLGIGAATSLHTVAGNLYAFVGFVAGSIAAGRFLRTRTGTPLRITGHALGLQLTLLIALTVLVAAIDVHAHTAWRYAVCAILALAMAIQTAIARHLAVQDVNTTVATMTLHDLAAASRAAGGDSVRWRRRAGVVVALLAGAGCGTALDQAVRWGGLALSSAIVALVLLVTLTLARDEQHPAAAADDARGHAGLRPSVASTAA